MAEGAAAGSAVAVAEGVVTVVVVARHTEEMATAREVAEAEGVDLVEVAWEGVEAASVDAGLAEEARIEPCALFPAAPRHPPTRQLQSSRRGWCCHHLHYASAAATAGATARGGRRTPQSRRAAQTARRRWRRRSSRRWNKPSAARVELAEARSRSRPPPHRRTPRLPVPQRGLLCVLACAPPSPYGSLYPYLVMMCPPVGGYRRRAVRTASSETGARSPASLFQALCLFWYVFL